MCIKPVTSDCQQLCTSTFCLCNRASSFLESYTGALWLWQPYTGALFLRSAFCNVLLLGLLFFFRQQMAHHQESDVDEFLGLRRWLSAQLSSLFRWPSAKQKRSLNIRNKQVWVHAILDHSNWIFVNNMDHLQTAYFKNFIPQGHICDFMWSVSFLYDINPRLKELRAHQATTSDDWHT